MAASRWLLEARTSKVENHEAQKRIKVKGVGSVEVSPQRPSRGPPCSPPLSHPLAERQFRDPLGTTGAIFVRVCMIMRVIRARV